MAPLGKGGLPARALALRRFVCVSGFLFSLFLVFSLALANGR
jgi:hypothetical protein